MLHERSFLWRNFLDFCMDPHESKEAPVQVWAGSQATVCEMELFKLMYVFTFCCLFFFPHT